MEEVEFEGLMGLPSVLLELTPVLRETELVELPVAGPTSVLLLAGALGVGTGMEPGLGGRMLCRRSKAGWMV
jgi:hypothetical protein